MTVTTPARAGDTTAPVTSTSARANVCPTPSQPTPARAIPQSFSSRATPARADRPTTPTDVSPRAVDMALLEIRYLASNLDDLERIRIANSHRTKAWCREFGVDYDDRPPLALDATSADLEAAEHRAELALKRAWRKHPLAAWAKTIPGVGEKSMARLIALTGDPADRPNPAKLWAYCGHGNPNLKRRTGMSQADLFQLGNPLAKKTVWLIANNLMKDRRSPYRPVYDAAREQYATREDWTDAHRHMAALRRTGKAFLKDLWREARRLREESARAEGETTSIMRTPARADADTTPTTSTPARAIVSPSPNGQAPARAIPDPSPGDSTPARAIVGSTSIQTTPARAGDDPISVVESPARALEGARA